MPENVYQAWSDNASVPLTIAATDAETADVVYREWRSIHSLRWSAQPSKIERMDDAWLKDRPQLVDAVRRAVESDRGDCVLYFLGHSAGWLAAPTYSARMGSIAPFEPLVQSFGVRVEKEGMTGLEVMLFARSIEEAIQLYLDWHGPVHHPYTIRPFSRWTLTGEQTTLREEMDLGMVGVAGWSSEGGYHIYPVDHELAGA